MSDAPRRVSAIKKSSPHLRIPRWVSRVHGRAIYCPQHNYGPMDVWYDCDQCSEEHPNYPMKPTFTSMPTESEREKWRAFQRQLGHRVCPVSKILKKIPRDKAESWLEHFEPMAE